MGRRVSVLFLTPWLPDRYHPAAGGFVLRHAEAISRYCDVTVVHVSQLPPDAPVEDEGSAEEQIGSLRVVHAYYRASTSLVARVTAPNLLRYVATGLKAVRHLGLTFDLIHANLLFPTGLQALVLSVLLRRPYVVTEHYTGYLPEHGVRFGTSTKLLTRLGMRFARAVTTVSAELRSAMMASGLRGRYAVVPNVATAEGAERSPGTGSTIDFAHLSFLEDSQKNVSGILRVVARLAAKRQDFRLRIIGGGPDEAKLRRLVTQLDIDRFVRFEGLMPHREAMGVLAECAFLVMFSNYETFCVALAEALAVGIPVVATNLPAPAEFLSADTGALVPARDEDALLRALEEMLDAHGQYDPARLRAYAATRFGPEVVGKQFETLYKDVLGAGAADIPAVQTGDPRP
jgi:glycosyltransferase involved in cell wall biosynthesis